MTRLPALLVAVSLAFAGCSAVERGSTVSKETSAVRVKSTAHIRRLVVLAPVVTRTGCSSGVDSWTGLPLGDPTINVDALSAWLHEWKDYEVTSAERTAESDRLVEDLAAWHQTLGDNAPVPVALRERLATWIASAREPGDMTGVLVIRSNQRCTTITDVVLWFLIVGMPNYISKLAERNASIALYEPAHGELLWMSYFNASTLSGLQMQLLKELENLPAASREEPPAK